MPTYISITIDGWNSATPVGASEKVRILDNAIREIKACVENTFTVQHNNLTGVHTEGEIPVVLVAAFGAFPAASIAGALAAASDENNRIYYDDGAAWVPTDLFLGSTPFDIHLVDATLTNADYFVKVNASGGDIVLTLPVAVDGKPFTVKRTDASANTVTLTPNGAETIDGAATLTLPRYMESITLMGDTGTGWFVVSNMIQKAVTPVSRGGFKNLSIHTVAAALSVDIDADSIVLDDGGGNYLEVFDLDVTVDLSAAGAIDQLDAGAAAVNTVYYLYACSKRDGTKGSAASLSSTWAGVTKVAGYDFGRLVGWCTTDATVGLNIEEFRQQDNWYTWNVVPKVLNIGAAGAPTKIDLSKAGLSTFDVVPADICKGVLIDVKHHTTSHVTTFSQTASLGTFNISLVWDYHGQLHIPILIESQAIYYDVGSGQTSVWVSGFELIL